MGHGDKELGSALMGNLLRKLWSMETKPARILFYNSGVKLLAADSPCLDGLDSLYGAGVDLIACGTCVDKFGLRGKLALGRVSDMQEIAEVIMTSPTVVTI
jgi:intracellular sulfur oxidation DsrE/DsrF family protein